MNTIRNFINGDYLDPVDNDWLDVYSPMNGSVHGRVANSSHSDIQLAVKAAQDAFKVWSDYSTNDRSRCLMNIARGIENNLDAFAEAEALDTGKPLQLAKTIDIPRSVYNFNFFAQAITQFSNESFDSPELSAINFTLQQPIGVAGCISPWNLPLYLFTWKIAPALAAGNTVIAKPSELSPLTASMLGEICNAAGLPKGALNIVHGEGSQCGQAIVEHPEVKAISFTGGTTTGKHIAKTAAKSLKKISLELGGKNPNIIFADCDYADMLSTAVKSAFSNQGQICLCGSRILVEADIYEQFKADFVARVKALKVGQPFDSETNVGAVISKAHMTKILKFIETAKTDGGRILCGGHQDEIEGHTDGYYIAPTVIEVDTNKCQLNQNEVFGPVVSIMPFKNEQEALIIANDVPYGLSATVWTNDVSRALRFSRALQVGIVWVNTWMARDLRTPFGGTKASGIGREGGFEALRFFTETKNICIKY